ncbi:MULTISPECIES: thiamine phosphate synthase [unclassified Luteococcus]|uniref:thiamine phosphate synthase n=1 Tax=unclassified Luteococcus TaxID=2639923 RepID=UPI00313A8F0E
MRPTSAELVEAMTCYLVTDTGICGGPEAVVRTVLAAVQNGATFVQVRDPDLPDDGFLELSRAVVRAVAGRVPVVLNDRVHLVGPAGADGAHIGQGDLPPVEARAVLGPDAILGLSVEQRSHVEAANRLPAGTLDYLGIGPVWAQQTKPNAAPPIGPDGLAELARLNLLPSVAIGGVGGPGRVAPVKPSGAGMAIVSAICGADDPGAATAAILREWQQAGTASTIPGVPNPTTIPEPVEGLENEVRP